MTGLAPNTVGSVERHGGNVAAFLRLPAPLTADFAVSPDLPEKTGIWRTVAGAHNLHRDPHHDYATPVPVTRFQFKSVDFDRVGSVLEPCVDEARAIEFALLKLKF